MRVVLVNHNTSPYAELALRSLLALNRDCSFDITIRDNASTDETASLFDWAHRHSIAVEQSGLTTTERANSHGEVLAGFVTASSPTDYFLFLDADICFLTEGTVRAMRDRLSSAPDLFAVQARMRLYVTEALGVMPRHREWIERPDGARHRLFPRPHPFCLLVRDTLQFRAVVDHIGLSVATRQAVSAELSGSYDTFGLAAAAMKTHGMGWAEDGGPVLHYAQAAERKDAEDLMRAKDEDCQNRLRWWRNSTD